MIGSRPFRALVLGLVAAAVALLLQWTGLALLLALGIGVMLAIVGVTLPALGVRWLDDAIDALRALIWRGQQGRHHAFNGVLLDVHDDGRHVWIDADGVRRLLRWSESPAHLAARFAGRTKEGEEGQLLLRVDALAEYLHSATTSRDPSRIRFLHYLERDLLFPAAERRRRSETMP